MRYVGNVRNVVLCNVTTEKRWGAPMDASDKVATIDTYNSSPNTPPSKVAVPWGRPSPQALAAIYRALHANM